MYTNMLLDLFCIYYGRLDVYCCTLLYLSICFSQQVRCTLLYLCIMLPSVSACIYTSLQVRCTQLGEENTVASDTEIPTRRREFLPSLTFLHVNRWRPVKQCLMRSPTQVNFVIYHLYKQVPLDFDCCIVTFSLQPLTHCFGHLLSDFCDRRKFN